MSADLGAIKRNLGPRKRHVNLNIQAAKEVKQRPIEGDLDLEQLLDDTREKRDQLQQHLTVYTSLRTQLEETAQSIGKREYDKVMEDYDDYADLTLEAEQLVVGLSSRMEMIKDRMEFKLRRGSVKVNIELEEKILEIERQKAEIEHRKLQIEAERLNLEKEKLKKKLEVETAKQDMKSNTVKLPKLDFNKFSGELLKWQEFWDSFESAIHSNASLNPVEKMNYLRAKLEGEAEEVISGLTLTNANYEEAIRLLQKRFGQNEIIINAHYTSLMDMPASSSSTSALRTRYDSIEKHLRSLQALGEDVNTKMLVSLIMTKLPKDVITPLTDHKEVGQEWTVQLLRDKLHRFITNRENAERQKEKIKGQCFICLKPGHHQKDCKANKVCVHCQQKNKHHRSLCINKFQEKPAETAHVVTETISPVTENTLLASDEQVLMQTATVEVENLEKSGKQTIRLLLDTGSQRSYITEQLADKLQLPIKGSETLTVYTFNTSKPRQLQTPVTELRLLTKDGSSLHLRVDVVPKITGTLQRACFDTKKIEHLLKDITLADSIPASKETASIELLLGSDYYCDIFSGDIQVVPGLNLMASKLGWILTGRIKCQEAQSAPSISMLTYTSSPCVLHWMKSQKPLPVFVQNRLKEIKSHKDIKFRYVTTTQNPADLATRGVSAEALIDNQLWWHGPSWLSDDETKWPSWDFQQIDDNTLDQMAKQASSPQIMYETPALIEMENKQEHSNYSCLTRLLRVTAWALRFILKVKKKKSTGKEELKAEEIEQAKLMWERHVQNRSFSSAINAVQKNTKNNLKTQLGLQLDQNRILRCHGRMIRENLPESSIFPKLLPKNRAFTSLLINSFHEKLMHAGVSHTHHTHQLSDENSGSHKEEQRRGKPKEIISDNASQFKLAKSTVEEAWQFATTSPDTQSYLANEGITWSFIIELAPWMGGFYELLVGLVKQALRKSIGKICLNIVQLETILTEIEAVKNSRPLVYVGADLKSGFALTPGDFLSLNPKIGVPFLETEDEQLQDPDFVEKLSSAKKLLETWKKGQKHLNTFWKLWFHEYVLSLRERSQKYLKAPRVQAKVQPTKGDVVLLKESSPRGTWKLAMIEEIITSR
ncbi:hypothetical protein P5673_018033 [Acropora cervicornis]|uniref:CCHC-type domain-containing protein n=1 Tax=Acropora cervicornis TaxID=6130 RepID=A0AAD9QDN8_ACRCE|nr:hypothetical protein P5673_018033 [Acropora cervicornis]